MAKSLGIVIFTAVLPESGRYAFLCPVKYRSKTLLLHEKVDARLVAFRPSSLVCPSDWSRMCRGTLVRYSRGRIALAQDARDGEILVRKLELPKSVF
jgi:hypothetical protein